MFFLHPFLKVLDILLALVAIYLAVYYAFNVTTAGILTPALATICSIPGASFLEICPGQLPKPSAQALPTAELNFTTRLEQLQLISAKSVDLPYHLQASEGAIGDMIVQLSATKAYAAADEYRDLVDATIDGLQDFLANIDQVVDNTIHINSWASYKLGQIEERGASPFRVIKKSITSVFGLDDNDPTEAGVRGVFLDMTAQTQKQLESVLMDARSQRESLRKLKVVLDNIAITVLGDNAKLDKEKMKHASYWKWIFKSHKNKMTDFDTKMELCASFYRETRQALGIVGATQLKLQRMQGELGQMRKNLQDAPVLLIGDGVPLQLYIQMLNSGVERLEAMRSATKMVKDEKVKIAGSLLKY